MKHNQMRQVVFPILAAFIWGTSFVSQDICADSMGAFTFNGTRYFIAVLSLLVVIAVIAVLVSMLLPALAVIVLGLTMLRPRLDDAFPKPGKKQEVRV